MNSSDSHRLPIRYSLLAIIVVTVVLGIFAWVFATYLRQRDQWFARDQYWHDLGFYMTYDDEYHLKTIAGLHLATRDLGSVQNWKLEKTVQTIVLRDVLTHGSQLQGIEELPQLWRLAVDESPISDDAINWIVLCPRLTTLNISKTEISDASIEKIASIKTLQVLEWKGSQITEDGIARLSSLRPKLQIVAGALETTPAEDTSAK